MFVSTIVYTHAVIFAIKYVETNHKVLDPYLLTIAVNSVSWQEMKIWKELQLLLKSNLVYTQLLSLYIHLMYGIRAWNSTNTTHIKELWKLPLQN